MTRWLGILMLETRFPRIAGDVGHPASWRMPVRYRTVTGASPRRVVREQDDALLSPFVDAARALQAQGASAITTSCGFLFRFQAALQQAVSVPVWTSSLLALPSLPSPGVITVDAASLQWDGAMPVEGLAPGCSLQRTLLDDLPALDVDAAEADTVAAARRLVARHPRVESLVLECTNLPPYAAAVERATGRSVHHLMTFVHERWETLR